MDNLTYDYRPAWKAARGYYETRPAFRWLSDEEADWWELQKREHHEALMAAMPRSEDAWRRLMGLAAPEELRARLDKDEVRSRVDMLDLLGRYGVDKIRTFGRRASGLCPFHKERTASFSADLDRRVWYCHGCSEGGDCFSFVMRVEDCAFSEAVRILNRTY